MTQKLVIVSSLFKNLSMLLQDQACPIKHVALVAAMFVDDVDHLLPDARPDYGFPVPSESILVST